MQSPYHNSASKSNGAKNYMDPQSDVIPAPPGDQNRQETSLAIIQIPSKNNDKVLSLQNFIGEKPTIQRNET